jgi:hypothetical protein
MPHSQLQLLILCHLIDERLCLLIDAHVTVVVIISPCWVDQ